MRWTADVPILLRDVDGVQTARKQSLTLVGQESAGGNPSSCQRRSPVSTLARCGRRSC
jgi:hypothetical protein